MKLLLATVEFDATRGGVGRYLHDIYATLPAEHIRVLDDADIVKPHWLFACVRILKALWAFDDAWNGGKAMLHVSHVLPLGTVAWILHVVFRREYIVSLHGMDFFRALEHSRKRWLLRKILLGASGVTVNTQALADAVRKFVGEGIQLLVVMPSLPLGYSTAMSRILAAQQTESSVRVQGKGADERVQLLSVGRLVERKGFDTVIRALHFIPHAQLTIIGDGPDRLRLEQLAEESGMWDRITFAGHLSEEAKLAAYARADVFVLPTRILGADREGFGIVYLEAQACGIPVIGGEGIGVVEAIHPKLRRYAVRHTEESVAQAIYELVPSAATNRLHHTSVTVSRQELRAFARRFDAQGSSKRFWKWLKRLG